MFGTYKNQVRFCYILNHTQSITLYFVFIQHPLPGFPKVFCTKNVGFKIAPAIIVAYNKSFACIMFTSPYLWHPCTQWHTRYFSPEICPGFSTIPCELYIPIICTCPNYLIVFGRRFYANNSSKIFCTGYVKR